jgi:hypothetical protein
LSGPTAILYTAHYITNELLADYAALRKSCEGAYDVVLLYDNFHDDFADSVGDCDSAMDVHLVRPDAIEALKYPSWPGRDLLEYASPSGLRPGNWDFAILDFYRTRPGYEHYWRVEYDVRFTGEWRSFFHACASSNADLLGTTLLRRKDSPPWFWWSSLGRPDAALDHDKTIRGFFPVARLSRRACSLLDTSYQAGWYGHAECVMPTVLAHHGFEVADLGGRGEFVPAGHEDRFYLNTPSDKCLQPGTFVFRPARRSPGERPNTLWHPVRDETDHERWIRRLADRGSIVAQFQMGVMYAKGQDVPVDLPQAYFWHALAASAGHESAAVWRDEIAKLLSGSELAAAADRLRRWTPTSVTVGPIPRQ